MPKQFLALSDNSEYQIADVITLTMGNCQTVELLVVSITREGIEVRKNNWFWRYIAQWRRLWFALFVSVDA